MTALLQLCGTSRLLPRLVQPRAGSRRPEDVHPDPSYAQAAPQHLEIPLTIDQPGPFAVAAAARRDLLTEHPATTQDHLIVRWPHPDDGWLALGWAQAAERIAGTFTGEAPDDALLAPYLYLYRHAFELALKHAIRYAVRLRRLGGDEDPQLEPAKVRKRLQYSHRHELLKLADEVDEHRASFNLEAGKRSLIRTMSFAW